jgi:hypothetical protein
VLGDGAEWTWNLADLHFPGAIQIVDLYHAREHLWKLARALHPTVQVHEKRWMMYHQNQLDHQTASFGNRDGAMDIWTHAIGREADPDAL